VVERDRVARKGANLAGCSVTGDSCRDWGLVWLPPPPAVHNPDSRSRSAARGISHTCSLALVEPRQEIRHTPM
jgi:hypothetical protein